MTGCGIISPEEPLSAHEPPIPEKLLAHREWVRVLARSLTSDAADADDVEQQTWLAALTSAPRDVRSVRAWLTRVASNAARKLRRTDARQHDRAARRPAPAPVRTPVELAEEADAHARVATAVVALDEPYREAVLLRYFEGLGIGDVAARSGVPVETARARLRRARDMLRARLDREFAPSRPWRAALAVLADGPRRFTHAADAASIVRVAGGSLMGSKFVVSAAVVLAVAAGWLWTVRQETGPTPRDVAAQNAADPSRPVADSAPSAPPRVRAHASSAADAAATAAAEVAVETPPAPAPTARERIRRRLDEVDPVLQTFTLDDVRGLDAVGRIADAIDCPVVLTRAAEAALAASPLPDAIHLSARIDGERLLLTLPPFAGLTHVVEEDRIVLATPGETVTAATEVVLAPRPPRPAATRLRGIVRDPLGVPVVGAQVILHDGADRVVATSRDDGTWAFERRGLGLGDDFVVASAPGRVRSAPVRIAAPVPDTAVDLIVGGRGGELRVRVTGPAGPVEGAVVSIGPESAQEETRPAGGRSWVLPRGAKTDATGACSFDGLPPGGIDVRAAKSGLAVSKAAATIEAGATATLDLVLTERPSFAATLAAARVTARFVDARIGDVARFIGRTHGVNIVVAPDLAARGDAVVSVSWFDEPLESALRTLCAQVPGASIEIRDADALVILSLAPAGK